MPQVPYRANLSSAIFPMTLAEAGRTVIVPGNDQNFDRRVDPAGEQKDAGIPQAIYMENVIPTVSGYQSVGYIDPGVNIAYPTGDPAYFLQQVVPVKAKQGDQIVECALFCFRPVIPGPAAFRCGRFGVTSVTIVGTAPVVDGTYSIAVVRDVVYLYAGTRLYEVTKDPFTKIITLTEITSTVTPAGFFTSEGILRVLASNNYLVAISATTVYYSSTTTATDFVSSLVTGAGQANPNEVDGQIVSAAATESGFYIFTRQRTVLAQYTGNFRFPWKYSPVKASQGIEIPIVTQRTVFGDSSTAGFTVLERNKQLKFIQGAEARAVAPEITEYLSKVTRRDVFNSSTNTFSLSTITAQAPSIFVWLNRYILVSCDGAVVAAALPQQFQTVLWYDTLLQRYGRLKIPHSWVFQVAAGLTTNAGDASFLAFVDTVARRVYYLSTDVFSAETLADVTASYLPHAGVFVLGKLQYVRSRKLCLEETILEGPRADSATSCTLHILPSQEGRNFDPAVPATLSHSEPGLQEYKSHITAQNHSLLIKGTFTLNTIQCSFHAGGGR